MAVAPVSLAMIGRIMLDPQLGIIAYAINTYTPFAAPNFLTNLPLLTVILMDTWNWTPFMFIILYAGMTSVPDELEEAARIDGAPTWRTYVHVIIPYMKPVIFVAFLIRLIDLFRTFGTVYGLTRGGPGNATEAHQHPDLPDRVHVHRHRCGERARHRVPRRRPHHL